MENYFISAWNSYEAVGKAIDEFKWRHLSEIEDVRIVNIYPYKWFDGQGHSPNNYEVIITYEKCKGCGGYFPNPWYPNPWDLPKAWDSGGGVVL
jgi:hypothetical protein